MKKVALGLLATMLLVGANTAWADSTPKQEATTAAAEASANDEQADGVVDEEAEEADEVIDGDEYYLVDEDELELTAEDLEAALIQMLDELAQESEAAEYQEFVNALTDELEQEQEWELALIAQKKLAAKLVRDKEVYQRIGQLYEKAGVAGIKTFINGNEAVFEIAPIVKDGRTLVPIREIAESLGAEVAWDANSRTITIVRGGVTVVLPVGKTEATVDGKTVKLDVPAEITNGRTVVPLRFVAEALQAEVEWIATGKVIVILNGADEQAASEDEQAASEDEQAAEQEEAAADDSEQSDEQSEEQTDSE